MSEYPRSAIPAETAVALVRSGIFDTYMVYEQAGTWIVAGGSAATVTLDKQFTHLHHDGDVQRRPWQTNPLDAFGETLGRVPFDEWTAYGWVAFELAYALTGHADLIGSETLAQAIVPRAEVHIGPDGTSVRCADSRLREAIDAILTAPVLPQQSARQPARVDTSVDKEWYIQAVTDAVKEIDGGRMQRVVVSRNIPLGRDIDLAETFVKGRAANTPARSFLLDIGGRQAAGFCPEMLLEVGADRRISTQPLAGTRPYRNDPTIDRTLRDELTSDPKEVHEHAVSVKHAFDELRGMCAPGTVKVDDLMSVEVRGNVQHLASVVSGELPADVSSWRALEAVFPATTSTGAPKQAACEYISKVEPDKRGLYSGGVLMASHDGSLEVGLVLRTLFGQDGSYWARAGAGLVASSQPEFEYRETCEKLDSICANLVDKSPADTTLHTAVNKG